MNAAPMPKKSTAMPRNAATSHMTEATALRRVTASMPAVTVNAPPNQKLSDSKSHPSSPTAPCRPLLRLIHALFGGFFDPPVVLLLRVLHAAVRAELGAHLVQLVLVED